PAAAAVPGAVSADAVPGHANHQRAVVAEVRWPPALRVGHQRREIFLQRRKVEALELFGVVEVLAHGIGFGGMLVQEFELQLVRPPVAIRRAAAGDMLDGAYGFGGHVLSPILEQRSLYLMVFYSPSIQRSS